MRNKIVAFILVIIFTSLSFAQNKISLFDTEEVKDYLILSIDQSNTIYPMIEQIKRILEEDKKIISDLKKRFNSGDEPGFFEKIKVKLARDSRVSKINELLDAIENQLNDKQKAKFSWMQKPELKTLDKKELTE